jgi:hypothetical protein
MTMSKLYPAVIACACAVMSMAAGGCSRISARTVAAPPPPLDIPSPPPRVVETADAEAPSPGTLVDAPTSAAPSSRPPSPRVGTPKPEPPKPEPVPPPVTEVPPPAEPAKPATTLQTTPPELEAAVEQEIRAKLDRANKDLSRVDYRQLKSDARQQYDQAKGFATRAEEALKQKNLVFARTLADNAANIAAQLAGR